MTARRVPWLMAAVAMCILAGGERVHACSCSTAGPPCESAWKADAIFVGLVVGIAPFADAPDLSVYSMIGFRVRLRVSEPFRGAIAREVDVYTSESSSSCGYSFTQGRTYLVYAFWEKDRERWITSYCSRTRLVEEAVEDLAYLRGPAKQPSGLGTVQGKLTREDYDRMDELRQPERPLANTRVTIEPIGTPDRRATEVRTDRTGSYSARVPVGRYRVTPVLPDSLYTWVPEGVDLLDARGCAAADFIVHSNGRIGGRVLRASGEPVAYLPIDALDVRDAAESYYSSDAHTMTDALGNFELERLPPATYRLGLDLRLAPKAKSDAVWFGEDPAGPPLDVVLGSEQRVWTRDFILPESVQLASVSGVVKSVKGDAVPKARVYLMAGGGAIAAETVSTVTGEFRFTVRAGFAYKVTADSAGSPYRYAVSPVFRAGTDLAPIVLQFDRE